MTKSPFASAWFIAAAFAVAMALPIRQAEAITFEGFEAGIPSGWTLSGSGGTSGAATNISPVEGFAFGYIDTLGGTSISGGTAGTTLLSSAFFVPQGSTLNISLNFLTNDGGGFSDFAFVKLVEAAGTQTGAVSPPVTLYTANTTGQFAQAVPCLGCPPGSISAGVTLEPATAFFDGLSTGNVGSLYYGPTKYGGGNGGSTGWVTSSFAPPSGTYQLLFGVTDVGDFGVDSGLAIDNITLDDTELQTLEDLIAGGATASELLGAGYTVAQLLGAGVSVADLKTAGVGVQALVGGGATASQLLAGGFTAAELFQGGVGVANLKAAGVGVQALAGAGATASQLVAGGFTAAELLQGGVSAADALAAGVGVSDLLTAGATVAELKAAGVGVSTFKTAGASPGDLAAAGFSVSELLEGGFTVPELLADGVSVPVPVLPAWALPLLAALLATRIHRRSRRSA